MLKSSGAMAVATMASRVMGMVREIIYARFMADGWVAGAFQLAFMVPNLFRRLLGEGALTASFIPLFKEKEKTEGEKEMWRAANSVISGMIIAACVIIALGMLGATVALSLRPSAAKTETKWYYVTNQSLVGPVSLERVSELINKHKFSETSLITPNGSTQWRPAGEVLSEYGTNLMLRLLRTMFPYLLLVCLAAVFMGMLNARGHFFIPAFGSAVLNVTMIASVLWLAPRMGVELHQQIFGLAIGVLVAGVAQAAFQLPTLRREGFRYHWVSPWGDPAVQRVVRQMIPGTIGVAAFQINVLLTQGMAFWVDPSIVASFQYAVRLMELPQGVFGISLATYLLPTLSGLAAEKKFPEFRATLNQGLDHLIFVNLLASILLFILATPMVRLLFEHGKFGPGATERVSYALVCLSPGLVAFSLVNILARAFYALSDTKTPMKVSIFCLGINLICAMALVSHFRQGGLGMANTLSAVCNVWLLSYALRRKLGKLDFDSLRHALYPILAAAVLAGLAAWGLSRFWEKSIGHEGLACRLGAVFVPILGATACYWLIAYWRKVPSAMEIGGLLRMKFVRARK